MWTGRVYGTNQGNLFLEIELTPDERGLTGTFRFIDSSRALFFYDVRGAHENGMLTLRGRLKVTPTGFEAETLEVTAVLTPNGSLRGRWESSTGAGGPLELFPHGSLQIDYSNLAGTSPPAQIYTTRSSVGTVRLSLEGISEIAQLLKRDFSQDIMTVTYKSDGPEKTCFFEEFLTHASEVSVIRYLKLYIHHHDPAGGSRSAAIELTSESDNTILIQGPNEAWVTGMADTLVRHLRRYESPTLTNIKKYGLGLNQLIFLAMLVFISEIESWERRVAFIAVVFVLLIFLVKMHEKFLPNFLILVSQENPNPFTRLWPTFISVIIGVIATAVSAFGYTYLSN